MMEINELRELNERMLGLGAPVEIDGQGYNKVHFPVMYELAGQPNWTDKQVYLVASTLLRYSKTQTSEYAEELKELMSAFGKKVKEVTVLKTTSNSVELTWGFNKEISEFIKTDMKGLARWTKPDGKWVLVVTWEGFQKLSEKFVNLGYSVPEVQKPELTETSKETTDSQKAKPSKIFKVIVKRLEKTIDTVEVSFDYNRALVDAIKTVPYVAWNAKSRSWTCYIETLNKVYDAFQKTNVNVDLKSLEPWNRLVAGWDKSFELVDTNKLPIAFKPYDFQPKDSKILLSKKWAINGNDMGCGKTFEQVMIGESLPMKKLVICPPTLRLNWCKEILAVNPKAKVNVIYSNKPFQVVDGWNIIGYPAVDTFLKELEKEQFQVIMIDEAHYCQAVGNSGNPESKRAFSVLRICATANYVFPITGTPKTNRNKNLFNILRLVRHPLTRGKMAFFNFGKQYCDGKRNNWGWDFNGNSNDVDLNKELTGYMVRHLKKEVLPDLKKQRIMTPVMVDLREYQAEIREYLKTRKNKGAEALARLTRARKILATQKVGESIDFAKGIINQDKKVVIVTCFTEVVKAVEQAFKGNVVKLVGGMSDKAKNEAIEEFQKGEPQVMVMNIIAGGVGVTLTRAYNMVINDFDWVVGNITQAEDRICRGGQTELCNIYYLYADGADMDETMVNILSEKSETINAVVDGGSGDELNFLDMLDKSLGVPTSKEVRKVVKVEAVAEAKVVKPVKVPSTTDKDTKGKSLEELWNLLNKLGGTCKVYSDERIQKMRLIMAIKAIE